MRKFILLLISIYLLVNNSSAMAVNPKMLMVIEENAGTASFYSLNGKNLGSIKLGYLPHEVTIDKSGKTAYVSNFGIKDYDDKIGTPGASISVIDIPNRVEKFRIYTFDASQENDNDKIDKSPHGVKLRPPLENELYVNTESSHQMLIFNVKTRQIIRKFSTDANTHNFVFSRDGKSLWLMAGPSGVIKVDPDTGQVISSLQFNTPVRGLVLSSDEKQLIASCKGEIEFIDPQSMQLLDKIDNLNIGQLFYSAISPNSQVIVAPAAFNNTILVIDRFKKTIIKRITDGLNPLSAKISDDGKFAFVTNATDSHITKINLLTLAVTHIRTKIGSNSITLVPLTEPERKPYITLAAPLPLSGIDAQPGNEMMRGYEFWKSLVNSAGGLFINDQSYLLKINYIDTRSDTSYLNQIMENLCANNDINILLSTYGEAAYNIESGYTSECGKLLTPFIPVSLQWQPNTIDKGYDYFINTYNFQNDLNQKYSFIATTYSAQAAATAILLQQTLQIGQTFDVSKLNEILKNNTFHYFY